MWPLRNDVVKFEFPKVKRLKVGTVPEVSVETAPPFLLEAKSFTKYAPLNFIKVFALIAVPGDGVKAAWDELLTKTSHLGKPELTMYKMHESANPAPLSIAAIYWVPEIPIELY